MYQLGAVSYQKPATVVIVGAMVLVKIVYTDAKQTSISYGISFHSEFKTYW